MAQRKVNDSEDLHRYADDGETKTERRRDQRRIKGREPREQEEETFCLLATGTCSPGGCPTAAPVLTGTAAGRLDWTY